ncbi:hypothetical protein ACIRLA_22155 [Streptomyces sp. NPDC102364]|uniref:hypothetical protein n=1 Tax=Streptomyces sp. NPDC102364 TaxID=3366161 RepID=UPI0037FC4FC7
MSDNEDVQPASRHLSIATASDGQAYVLASDIVTLLRAIADSCRNLADEPECDLRSAAGAIDYEADNIDCMAIERTR